MGDISEHFDRSEFECKDNCGFVAVDIELISVLEDLRSYFGGPITITSGCRCQKHNTEIPGAAPNSMHTKGIAVDFKTKNSAKRQVHSRYIYDYLDRKYPNKYGIGLYNNRIHLDVRSDRARWSMVNAD